MRSIVLFLLVFFCSLVSGQAEDNPSLLIIPDSLKDVEVLAQSVCEDVLVVDYNTRETSLNDLLFLIKKKLNGRLAGSIAFANHDYGEGKFYLTAKYTVSLGNLINKRNLKQFWKSVGQLLEEDGRVDLLACNLARSEDGKLLVAALKKITGREVAASDNETGNPEKGGDWILETADLDVTHLYFDASKLDQFKGLLWSQIKKLTASSPNAEMYFGSSVSLSGDIAVIGAQGDMTEATAAGAVFIHSRDQGGEENWGLVKKILPGDGVEFGMFGFAAALDGDTLVVSALGDDENGAESGSAYIFQRNLGGADNWGLVKKITGSDTVANDYFGQQVAISGDVIAVGSELKDDTGAVYIFYRNQGGADNWGQVKKVTASDGSADDYFGADLDLNSDLLVVGADGDTPSGVDSGSAYVFYRDQGGADNWGEVKKLTASDGAADKLFGFSVAGEGDTVVVGSPSWGANGSVYVYYRNQGGVDNWGEVIKREADDGAVMDSVGFDVDLSGDVILVSAHEKDFMGAAYVFERNLGGADSWGQKAKLESNDIALGDHFGVFVAVEGDTSIITAVEDDDVFDASGSAYVFLTNAVVTVTTVAHGATDSDGENEIQVGGSITITATPDLGYYFSEWTGDASGSANPLTIDPVYNDMTITPVFLRQTGTLNVNINAGASGGSFSISGPPDFNGGSSLTGQTSNFSAVVPTGTYSVIFSRETGYGISVIPTNFNVSGGSSSGVLGYGATETITGTYTQGQYTVYVNGANGGNTNRDGANSVNHGDNFTLTATANPGFNFTGWTGDVISSDNPLTINNITSDLNITPNFSQGSATLNVNLNASTSGASYSISGPSSFNGGSALTGQTGNFSSAVPVGTYVITFTQHNNWGISLITTAMAVSGYVVTGELGDGATETVTATYAHNQYTVTVPTVTGGSTDRNGANPISHGGNITITATAASGYNFKGWTGDVTSTDNPLTISNITRDYTVSPVFEALPGKGHLEVTLLGTKQGKWRLTGESVWRSSGVKLLNLATGEYVIQCKAVKGFHTPEAKTVVVNKGQTTYVVITYNPLMAAPQIRYFTATPDIVEPGGVVTLEWDVDGADRFVIDGNSSEHKDSIGSVIARVDADTEFKLEASNSDGDISASANVKVEQAAEILVFTSDCAAGHPLFPGNSATIHWFVKGANTVVLTNKTTGKRELLPGNQGSIEVSPGETTEYLLTANNTVSLKEASCMVNVSDEPFINNFNANCLSIYNGNKVKLSWDVQGVDTVEISPGVGQADAVGLTELEITENTLFTLKAGEKESKLDIKVVSGAPDLKAGFLSVNDRKGKNLKKPLVGQLTSLQVKVENKGSAACSAVVVRLVNAERVIDQLLLENLAAGKSKTVEFQWLPRKEGRHKLELIVDPADAVSEINEKNNVAKKKIRVKGSGGVDLLIDDLQVVVAEDGKTAKVSWSVINIGNEGCGSFQYQLYLAKGAKHKLNKALALVADDYLESLAAGEVVTFSKVVELSKKSKKLYLHGLVDVHDAITEVNELNNSMVIRIK